MVCQRCFVLHGQHVEQLGFRIQYLSPCSHHPQKLRQRDYDGGWLVPRQEIHTSTGLLGCNSDARRNGVSMGRRTVEGRILRSITDLQVLTVELGQKHGCFEFG
jgi:hypothetical protein